MIKAIIFDFDGVLTDSVNIKTEAFCELFKHYPNQLEAIKQFHLQNGGVSRYEKIRYFYENILRQPLPPKRFKELCAQFHELVVGKVVKAPFIAGAEELLEKCLGQYRMYIASATPEDEIREIVRRRRMQKYFSGVFGSPKRKERTIQEVIEQNRLGTGEVIFIGDSANDLNAAKAAGIHFIAVIANGGVSLPPDPSMIKRFIDLTKAYSFLASLN